MTYGDCRDDCPIPFGGNCPRHRLYKNAQWVQLCIHKPAYFAAWESGRGPGQALALPEPSKKPAPRKAGRYHKKQQASVTIGAGTELKRLLRMAGITPQGTCGCEQRARLMDSEGPDWCERNLEKIVDWLQEEAGRRHLPFFRLGAKALVRLAIRIARKKLRAVDGHTP